MPKGLDASVIIPTRNRPALLLKALDSVLRHIDDRIEVVVVDDGSSPPAREALPESLTSDPRLVILRNDGANGAAVARNFGVANARGRVLFFLDDDDLMLPGYCGLVLAAMADRKLPWGFSPILHHGVDGPAPWTIAKSLNLKELPRPFDRRHLTGLGCGFWVRSELFRSSGGLDAEFRVNEDTEFCLRLLSLGHLPWLSDTAGVTVLNHGVGISGAERSVTRAEHASLRANYFAKILDRYQSLMETSPGVELFLVRRYLKTLAKTATFTAGLAAAKRYRVHGATRYFIANWLMYRLSLRRSRASA